MRTAYAIDPAQRCLRNTGWAMFVTVLSALCCGTLFADVFEQTQMLPGGVAGRHLGWSVAVDGDWALIGAPRIGRSEPGTVEVYQRGDTGQWQWFTSLSASDGTANDQFGAAIAIDDDAIVIGAPGAIVDGWIGAGRAYVFRHIYMFPVPPTLPGGHVFYEVKQLDRPATGNNFEFGRAVAVAGDVAIASTPHADLLVNASVRDNAGMVSVYRRDAGGDNLWGNTANLVGAQHVNGQFGYDVATDGMRLLIGAPGENLGNPVIGITPNAGRAYFYDLDASANAIYRQFVRGSTVASGRAFGAEVAISGNYAAVGAPVQAAGFGGSVDIFEFTGSVFQFVHRRESPFVLVAQFGGALAMEGSTLVVGAQAEPYLTYTNTGRAYVYGRNTGGTGHWGQVQALFPDTDGIYGYDWLGAGADVALNEGNVIVGAPIATYGPNPGAGTAFVFAGDTLFANGFQCPVGQFCVISP